MAAALVLTAAAWIAGAYRWLGNSASARDPAAPSPAGGRGAELRSGERQMIAVLPFTYVGNTPGDDLIVDGFTHELIRHLRQIDGLGVRAATSPRAPQDNPSAVQGLARQLGATLVLAGSVSEEEGTIRRISMALITVTDASTVWAQSFVPDNNDILAVKEQIALAVANTLRLRLALGQRLHQTTPELYTTFLQARALQLKRGPAFAEQAVALFETVIAGDPSYVPALAGLANALATFTRTPRGERLPPPNPRMEWAARRAMRLDPLLADAQAAMGNLSARDRHWDLARSFFATAIELDPLATTSHTDFVLSTLLPLGKINEAVRVLDDALVVDPMSL